MGLKLRMPLDAWNALTPAQKNAMFHVLDNYDDSPNLEASLQHRKNEAVGSILVRFGPRGWNPDGTSYEFPLNRWGQLAAAAVQYERSGTAGTDIVAGSTVVISFNSEHVVGQNGDWFGRNLIHELLHPFVPDQIGRNGGEPDDHDPVEGMTYEAWLRIVPAGTLGGS